MYHKIPWRLDKFDIHKGRVKTNVETRRNSWRTYGETQLIKFISCEVLLQELVYLINLVSRLSSFRRNQAHGSNQQNQEK